MMSISYVVGQWVRGDRFYGRGMALDSILGGHDSVTWLIGGRRIGKTSVLRQAELLATAHSGRLVPLYWDLQGANDVEELVWTFCDAVLDADALGHAHAGEPMKPSSPHELCRSIEYLSETLSSAGKTLLLLCDEAEELLRLRDAAPAVIAALTTPLAAGDNGIRVVVTGSIRLLALSTDNSTPPVPERRATFLGPFEPSASRSLIRQDHLAEDRRPGVDSGAVEAIRRTCGDHPYLMQLLGKRLAEIGDLERAIASVLSDPMVEHFVAVDMALLDEADRRVLLTLALADQGLPGRELEAAEPAASLSRLVGLGYATQSADDCYEIRNLLLKNRLVVGFRSSENVHP